jgi:hypothetical protein
MTDEEPRLERAHDDEGSAAYGEQALGEQASDEQPVGEHAPMFGSPDVLIAGPPAPKRRLAPVLTSAIVVLAIVLGGGAFTAVKLLASKGSQPDKWAPSNSIAFAKFDLDPSASAKVAAWEFEQKFPTAPKIASADQLKDGLLSAAFDDGSGKTGNVDYPTDIKPWLGDRLAFAVFVDTAGKVQTIDILAVTDATKARAALAKLVASTPSGDSSATDGVNGDFHAFSIQDDFVILGANQAVVDEAVASAKKGNIGANSTYTSDIAQLKSDRIATVWWDSGATLKAMQADLPATTRALLLSGGLTGLPDFTKAGRFVMGLRVQPTYAELQGRILGSSSPKLSDGDAGTALGDLPGGTVAGISLANPEQLLKTELASLQSGLLGSSAGDQMDQLSAELGISVPGDLENLLGSQLAIGINALPDSAQALDGALFTAMTHPDDLAKALKTVKILIAGAGSQLGASGVPALTATTSGSSLVITDDTRSQRGRLSDDPVFRSALDGMPSKAVAAGFVNLSTVIKADQSANTAGLSPLQGIGFFLGTDATSPVFAVRLTVK